LLAIGWNAPVLAGAVTGVVCLGSVAAARVGRPLQQSLRRQRRARSRLATNVGEKLDALRTIQVSGRGHREARRIDRQGAELSRHGAARGRASAALRFWSQLTNGMSAAVALWIGALEVGAGRATAGDVVAAMTVLGLIGPPVRELARAFEVWQAMRITRGKLTAFLALGRRRIDVQSPVQTQGLLELQDVRVGGSPPRTARVVPGTLIALVGENGAGKSTWLRVLAGLQAAEGGRVLLDGADVARMDAEVRRKHVGLAAPDLPLVAGSVSKNVRYRWPRPTPEALGEALHVAGIGSLGAAGGEALGRRVGELGRELSSGERARVGLACAILGHPALLLLDEVDAHLDGPSRARLAQWLRGYPGVVVVASHDPEIVAAAKQVWRVELPAPRNLPASAALLLGIALSIAAGVRPAEARTLQEVSEAASPAEVQGLEVDIGRRGLVLGHEAQDWGLRLGGRLQLDAADFDSDEVEVDDRIDWRRGRLRLSDSFGEHWRARAEYDFLGVVEG
jgi:ABC-type bacteriocin/lantibiotic exporter with double-glycine peptidase domain